MIFFLHNMFIVTCADDHVSIIPVDRSFPNPAFSKIIRYFVTKSPFQIDWSHINRLIFSLNVKKKK